MRAPKSVLLALDWMVETQALNRHWKLPRIRIGNGHHSERERAWDRQRRAQLARERGRPRLVQLPTDEREGLAEKIGVSRRTIIRVKAWLAERLPVRFHHEGGLHLVPDRFGTMHTIGRGGCGPGGIGCATEWRIDVAPAEPPPEPESPAPPPSNYHRRPLGEIARELPLPAHARGP